MARQCRDWGRGGRAQCTAGQRPRLVAQHPATSSDGHARVCVEAPAGLQLFVMLWLPSHARREDWQQGWHFRQ